ncbi:cobalamin B12-binding domain-containing protein [Streptomyces physcomitrii]|uniref:Cobalamin B12-binding domain-containing protein n=1 Tax=Streptomyces physcomitrii TaxID=2724184 RepID=A0ABX1H253_9ACTN|nr:cobalamin-dependent protein [Streptomyces physcomitrii]NKI42425.1 cobalamin B12-binding domain-containing protein [Streptomyces physcomitrii]
MSTGPGTADPVGPPHPPPAGADGLEAARTRLWEAVRVRDAEGATAAVHAPLDQGYDMESVLLDVIAPVQARVGREWAGNRMTVAEEHAATALNDRVVGALSAHPASRPGAPRGRVAVACVDGEWHALPARLLAEVLRVRGWEVDFLGAHVPSAHLVDHLHTTGPDAVALSSSLATRLPTAHAAVTACQAIGVPVLVGGAAFGAEGQYARLIGADAWAPDARGAAGLLAAGLPRPVPKGGGQPVDALPYLADQEYTMVGRTRPRLVRQVMGGLETRFPAMAEYGAAQRQRTAEDLAHVVDFLAAALYTDDDRLFGDFLVWTAGVLNSRGVPDRSLDPALELLAGILQDFPRSNRILAAGLASLAAARGAVDEGRPPGRTTENPPETEEFA